MALAATGEGRAQPRIGLMGDLVHAYTVQPGQSVEGLLVLANPQDRPQTVRLYLQDYRTDDQGHPVYAEPGSHARSNAPWIRLGQSTVTVPPGEQLAVAYAIRVPPDGTLTGTYWSALMVEPGAAEPGAASPAPAGPRVSSRPVWRYAIHLVTHIDGPGEARLAFVRPRLLEDAGGLALQVDMVNEGVRWLRPQVWLELYDQEGRLATRVDGAPAHLYPGDVARQRLELGSLPPGPYEVLLVADNGDAHVFAAHYRFVAGSP
ncbi:MAG: hypothetical protein GX496_01575 [Firmicutes bacterium]|nr:hypothetical protein [Bacillota bacterium]